MDHFTYPAGSVCVCLVELHGEVFSPPGQKLVYPLYGLESVGVLRARESLLKRGCMLAGAL